MFCDQDYEEVIRYVSTRWLCLEKWVDRELKKYEGLRFYFLSEGFQDDRFKRLEKTFNDPKTELFLMFFQSTHSQKNKFMNKLAGKFMKP